MFGPVSRPFYSIRFATESDAAKFSVKTPIFWVKEYSSVVIPNEIKSRGSDASSKHDEEPAEEEVEYSDDEEERIAKKRIKEGYVTTRR